MYKIPVTEAELTLVESIDDQWKELFLQAKNVDRSLIKVKKKFTLVKKKFLSFMRVYVVYCVYQITNEQVATFLSEVGKFNAAFKAEGPASVGTDLESGM